MRGQIIDEPWISAILAGKKTWEMRNAACRVRGRIALIRKGSGQVVGVADVVDSLPEIATAEAYALAEPRHAIPPERQAMAFRDGWRTPWVLRDAKPLAEPIAYRHKSGAVIWAALDDAVAAVVARQMESGPAGLPPPQTLTLRRPLPAPRSHP